MPDLCLFCNNPVTVFNQIDDGPTQYKCLRCGYINLTDDTVEDFTSTFDHEDSIAISITLRNEWERGGEKKTGKKITTQNLKQIISAFRPIDPIEKMDRTLQNFEKATRFVGGKVNFTPANDYPLYFCNGSDELRAICKLLLNEGLVFAPDPDNPYQNLNITAKGYQRLGEIKKPNRDSRKCFVAMWFSEEMDDVYVKAIKPAIEFVEEGETIPRFEAVKIDNVEHVNDINDEIISQIRRCRFMVCDLTGYRGGVYFEAGFAYGLGLDVIYTCRDDWTKDEILKNDDGKEVPFLFNSKDKKISIKKEGVHFDLAHRNRIDWSPGDYAKFKKRLEYRIKSIIY